MFLNKTTFILGAGASWHYGYPTGEGLVTALTDMAVNLRDHCNHRIQSNQVVQEVPRFIEIYLDRSKGFSGGASAWRRVASDAQQFIDRLQVVKPTLIDYFLGWNESLQPIGKLLIAAVILDCEAKYRKNRSNQNKEGRSGSGLDSWYRFLIHKLLLGCKTSADLFKNNVQFVTFNYDTSLEELLFEALSSIDMIKEEDVRRFLEKDRVIHVYGSVHPGIPLADEYVDPHVASNFGQMLSGHGNLQRDITSRQKFLDQCLVASNGLRTIDPHDKAQDKTILDAAKRWIDDANVVYILGYGFDDNNNDRLDLRNSLRVKPGNRKSVMFTNYGDLNTVNKRASRVFYGTYDKFLTGYVHGFPSNGDFREKSIRTVYEALEKDFDVIESLLIAGPHAPLRGRQSTSRK